MTSSPITVTLEVSKLAIDPTKSDVFGCSRCGQRLDIHQPESERPDRLLGTCPDCGGWYAIGLGGSEAIICSLPGAEWVRAALASAARARPGGRGEGGA